MRALAYAAVGGVLTLAGLSACFLGDGADPPICPPDLQPTFGSIRTHILSTSSCGTSGSGCHSHDGAQSSGGLDLSTDPYHALLGDGGGALAENIAGDAGRPLLRVVPGDPAHSFLVIKLATKSSNDPQYGSGMPFLTPGSTCPSALHTIEQWIEAGAPNN